MHYAVWVSIVTAAASQIGPPMSDSPLPDIDPAQVTTWPGAVVAVALIAGTIILAVIVVQNRRLEKRLGKTNHGSQDHGQAIDTIHDMVKTVIDTQDKQGKQITVLTERVERAERRPTLALFGRR